MKVVLDASVIIDHLRGRPREATDLILDLRERRAELWSSYVVRVEVLAGMRPDEEDRTMTFLGLIRWEDVSEAQSDSAGTLGRRYLRSHTGLQAPDLLVAELALRLGAELLTTNLKHFPMFPELRAPYGY